VDVSGLGEEGARRLEEVTGRDWATANDVELVFLPTYGSWLNWIESEFASLRQFALNGTDHHSHAEQNMDTYTNTV
jgi:hypothetical protein